MPHQLDHFTAMIESIANHQPLAMMREEARMRKISSSTSQENEYWYTIQEICDRLADLSELKSFGRQV